MAVATPARTADQPATPPGLHLPVVVQTVLFSQFRTLLLPLLHRRYGDVFTIRVAPNRLIVMLVNPADIKTVFAGPVTVFHAGEGNAILGPVMGRHSVLLVDEDKHRRVRRLLMPAFHGTALRGYQDLVARLAKQEVDRWPTGRVFASHERMHALTLEIILQVVFGVTDPARLDALRPLVRRLVDIGPVVMAGWFYPRLQRVGPWKRYLAIQRELDRVLYTEIAQRRGADDLDTRDDVLSRLLRTTDDETADRLTDAELRDQLITLLLAGHETTATTLAWSLHELSRDPETLRAAQRAADAGDDEYLSAVAKEALRKRPVIYEVARRLTEPTDVAGYRMPAGTVMAPAIGLVQNDAENFPAPEDFRPERFLDGQPAANTWIPFGGGVRRCLGAGFSLLEASVVLREVLRRFDVTPERPRSERQKARNITLVPARGARIAVTPRGSASTG
jgi:cytochrome P450